MEKQTGQHRAFIAKPFKTEVVIILMILLVFSIASLTVTCSNSQKEIDHFDTVDRLQAQIDTLRTLWGYAPYIGLIDSNNTNVGLLHLRQFTGSLPLLSSTTILIANMREGLYWGRVQFDTTETDTIITLRIYKGGYR